MICFKIPGEDVALNVTTVKELIREVSFYDKDCVAGVYINYRKIHVIPGGAK